MKTITIYIVLIMLCFTQNTVAQDSIVVKPKSEKIEDLQKLKERIKQEEKELLKEEIESVNTRLENGDITQEEAEILKKEYAEKRAKNIENRIAIVDNKIELLQRNRDEATVIIEEDNNTFKITIGDVDEGSIVVFSSDKDKPKKYDRRTSSDLVFAFGFNNALIDEQSLDDSPYKLGGSGFVELGWAWKTRLLKNSNALRLKYGFSFQWNKLNIKDNQYIVNNDGVIQLEEFPYNINKAKFRMTNLVFPVHLEFGPSKKTDHGDYFRYSTRNQFKMGLGGFAGFNLQSMQKLKYKKDDKKVKDKIKSGYDTTVFVYGLSAYIAFDAVALYVKYDLSPIFKHQDIEQNNISVGLRFDMD